MFRFSNVSYFVKQGKGNIPSKQEKEEKEEKPTKTITKPNKKP
jgi:hypothetical protein